MTDSGEEPSPGVAPDSSGPVGTVFAALYGELEPHPWREPDAEQDLYALFHARSQAMGWLHDIGTSARKTATGQLTDVRQVGATGLWGMNDAGLEHPLSDPEAPLAAWVQVGVRPLTEERPIPVQPLLRCVGDAVARIGTLRLRAVQLLLPVQCLDPAASRMPPSLFTAEWFLSGAPGGELPVRVTLDSGQDPSLPEAVPGIRERINRQNQEVFVCRTHSPDGHEPLALRPPFGDHLWNGPSLHRTTFHGTLAEWSLDALGWVGGFLADLSACQGVDTPLVLTAVPE
ncbi:hypothetical protein SAMN04487820_102508 [Actinopolyspora mzabensis]|uniref:Uncharacterized protein n=1 Tax=Actinopolyspora mzabensis TaxID=995066 RepID=A0A1G8XE82_ACTMZ|nr:hypothetical protein [Actinopolyspora mzabensis]SDJ88245.1 hypothetical protein SAMN04487820_102508 [Actinopolyspora mzabensis]